MVTKNRLLVWFLTAANSFGVIAQGEQVVVYSLEHALPSRQIQAITQDLFGFIWVGTRDGLGRFDGYGFDTFTSENIPGLNDHTVLSLKAVGSDLWFGTPTGLYKLDLTTYQAIEMSQYPNVISLYVDKEDQLWFEDRNGNVNVIDGNSMRTVQEHYNKPWTNSAKNLVAIFGENDRGVWWSRLDGSLYQNPLGGDDVELLIVGDDKKFRGKIVLTSDTTAMLFEVESAWWIRLNSDPPTFERLDYKFKGRGSVTSQVNSELLIHIEGNELFEIHLDKKSANLNEQLSHFLSESAGANDVLALDDSWWIGTNSGLIKSERRPELFDRVLHGLGASVRSIYFHEDKTLISTYNGLYYLDSKNNIEWHVNYPYKVFYQYFSMGDKLFALDEGRGLMAIDLETQTFDNLTPKDDGLNYSSAVFFDERIFLAGFNGFFESSPDLGYKIVADKETGLNLNEVRIQDMERQDDLIWVGSDKGLFRFFPKEMRLEMVTKPGPIKVRDIYMSDDVIWLGTENSGLLRYHPQTDSLKVYDESLGLANNTVNSVTTLNDTLLWVATNNGLTALNLVTGALRNYHEEDGISHNEFNRKAIAVTESGELWLGGLDGVTVFDPDQFKEIIKPPVQLMLIGAGKYNGKSESVEFQTGSVIHHRSFDYHYSDRLYRFKFGLTDFNDSENNKFRYQIEGLHTSWVDLQSQRELLIDNLSPGNYILQISGTNGSGIWSEPLLLELRVSAAYYQQIWFYAIILVLLIGLGIGIHKIRVAQILKIERVRGKIARDLHDELGSTLTRISMASEIAMSSQDNQRELSQVTEMSREASHILSDIVWSVDNTEDTLWSLLDRIKDHLYAMTEGTTIESKFISEGIEQDRKLESDVKQNIFLITKEAINNSVKYSTGTLLEVSVQVSKESLLVHVSDDGDANDNDLEELRKKGNGLRNMKVRSRNIGAIFEVTNTNGFTISVEVKL